MDSDAVESGEAGSRPAGSGPAGSGKAAIKRTVRAVLAPLGVRLGTFTQHAPRPLPPAADPRPEPGEALPSICVATPSRNQRAFIEGAMSSVLDQGYPRIQYAVADGASTDETPEILERWDDRLTWWRSAPDGGQAAGINLGFAHVEGEIMAWLNADDRLLDGSLLAVGRFMRDHPEIDVVYGHRLILDPAGKLVGRWVLPSHSRHAYRWRDYVPQETMFWRRALWEKAGGRIDESLDFAIDWDLLLRFDEAGARFCRLPAYLGAFTTHPAQKSLATRAGVGEGEFRVLQARVASGAGARLAARAGSGWYMLRSACSDWRARVTGSPPVRGVPSAAGSGSGSGSGSANPSGR